MKKQCNLHLFSSTFRDWIHSLKHQTPVCLGIFLIMLGLLPSASQANAFIIPYLTASPGRLVLQPHAQSFSVYVSSNIGWEWFISGQGITSGELMEQSKNQRLDFTIQPNTSVKSRTFYLTVRERRGSRGLSSGGLARSVTIVQEGVPSFLKVLNPIHNMSHQGGVYAVSVSSNDDWSASLLSEWAVINSPRSNSGDGNILVKVLPNTSLSSREVTLTIHSAGKTYTHTLIQEGVPTLTVSPRSESMDFRAHSFYVTVHSGIAWSAYSTVPWLTVSRSTGVPGYSRILIRADENPDNQTRTGQVEFISSNGLKEVVHVTQDRKKVLEIDRLKVSFASLGGSFRFTITANGPYTVSTDQSWVTLPFTSGEATNKAFIPVVLPNTTPTNRVARITLSDGLNTRIIEIEQRARLDHPLLCDMDGDGFDDLIVINPRGNNQVFIYLGNGNGTFKPKALRSSWGLNPKASTFAGDFNGDGYGDLGVFNADGRRNVQIRFGLGNGQFKAPTSFFWNLNPEVEMVAGDFNGDGLCDIGVYNPNGRKLFYTRSGLGDGTFGRQAYFRWDLNPSAKIVTGDFNGDGKWDIGTFNPNGNRNFFIRFGLGNGTFGTQTYFKWNVNPDAPFLTGDVNGDGKWDIASENPNHNGLLFIRYGDGKGQFPRQSYFKWYPGI